MKALALLVLLLAPLAAAQRESITIAPAMPDVGGRLVGGPFLDIRLESADPTRIPAVQPWFLVGHDALVNVTLRSQEAWLNATFDVNVTGARAAESTLQFSVPPYGERSQLLAVHADDVGKVTVELTAVDAVQPDGRPIYGSTEGPAVLAPSVTFLDPPVLPPDDEYDVQSGYGGVRSPSVAFARIAPGDPLRARLQVRNDLPLATNPFRLSLEGGRTIGPVDVRSLEPGEAIIVEFPEVQLTEAQPSGVGSRYFGLQGQFELRAIAEFTIAGATARGHLGQYRVDRGAVTGLLPATAMVEIQDGLAVEFLTPRDPRLGVPTRLKLNATNLGRTSIEGSLVIFLSTPYNLYYDVQGPESRTLRVDLRPGEAVSESIELTPRVTGQWSFSTLLQGSDSYTMTLGGGGFVVKGPIHIKFDTFGTEYARIGERVQVGLAIETSQTLQDAQLRVATGGGYFGGFGREATGGGAYRPGLTQRLVDVESSASSLGTLTPGGVLNVTLDVAGRGSGRFDLIPYVLAEGFAYTSRPYDPAVDGPIMTPYGFGYGVQLAVQPRPVPVALALAPLTVGLAVFVGTWTLRTRFVK